MLGDTLAHLGLDEQFVEWVIQDKLLDRGQIVVEWLTENPFKHNNPSYAPVGDKMFMQVDESVELVERDNVK